MQLELSLRHKSIDIMTRSISLSMNRHRIASHAPKGHLSFEMAV